MALDRVLQEYNSVLILYSEHVTDVDYVLHPLIKRDVKAYEDEERVIGGGKTSTRTQHRLCTRHSTVAVPCYLLRVATSIVGISKQLVYSSTIRL